VRAAFRDLHGARLHGFALLVALGDRQRAATATSGALHAAAERTEELRHPERAAAWLRASVVRSLAGRRLRRGQGPGDDERRHALAPLGVDADAYHALAQLSALERAALVASDAERLAAIDVETVLGGGRARAERTIREARRRYLAACLARAATAASEGSQRDADGATRALVVPARGLVVDELAAPAAGALAERVRAVARRTLATGTAGR
jgi:hypothetical protein